MEGRLLCRTREGADVAQLIIIAEPKNTCALRGDDADFNADLILERPKIRVRFKRDGG